MAEVKGDKTEAKPAGQTSIAVARFLPDGTADPSFNNGRGLIINLKGYDETATGIAIDAQDGILLGGYAMGVAPPNEAQALLAIKLKSNGALESRFAHSGIAMIKPPHTGARDPRCADAALDAEGRCVLVGTILRKNGAGVEEPRMLFARLTSQGILDHTFGENGIIISDWAGYAQSIAFGKDRKILVGGSAMEPSGSDFACAVIKENGTFPEKGLIKISFGQEYQSGASSVVCDGDGRFTLAGNVRMGENVHFALSRNKSDGFPDTSFGGKGRVFTEFNVGASMAISVGLFGDKPVVAGRIAHNGIAVARYNQDGSLDETFSGDGKAVTSPPRIPETRANDAIVTDNGNTVVCGLADKKVVLIAYDATGDILRSFGKQGVTLYDDFTYLNGESPAGAHIIHAHAMARDSKNRLVVAGSYIQQ